MLQVLILQLLLAGSSLKEDLSQHSGHLCPDCPLSQPAAMARWCIFQDLWETIKQTELTWTVLLVSEGGGQSHGVARGHWSINYGAMGVERKHDMGRHLVSTKVDRGWMQKEEPTDKKQYIPAQKWQPDVQNWREAPIQSSKLNSSSPPLQHCKEFWCFPCFLPQPHTIIAVPIQSKDAFPVVA